MNQGILIPQLIIAHQTCNIKFNNMRYVIQNKSELFEKNPLVSGDRSYKQKALFCNQRGYTLVELMIVISIISILATLAQPNYVRYRIRAKETNLQKSLFVFRDVIDQFYADHGKYPDSLEVLADKKYVRAIPQDPFTRSSDTWILIPPSDESEGGVYDVHSGSDKIGLNGTPYNEW